MPEVVALDLSLTGTGVAQSSGVSTLKTKLKDEARLDYLTAEILDFACDAELVIIEGLAFGTQTGKAMERAGLHYMVRTLLWQVDTPFAVCPPTVLKMYATGKGNSDKDSVMLAAAKTYPNAGITNNNEADAQILYALAMDHLGEPLVELPALNRRALEKVEWP